MRNNDFYITIGQVTDIFTANRSSDVDKFSDYIIDQTAQNEALGEDFDIKKQRKYSRVKKIDVLHSSTDFNDVQNTKKNINNSAIKPRKIVSVPLLSVNIHEQNTINSIIPQKVICEPFTDLSLDIPKRGQWIYIVAMNASIINNTIESKKMVYYYFPFSLERRKRELITSINSTSDIINKKLSINQARNILWSRSGSSISQNSNGKAYSIIDESKILLSTGFSDLPQNISGNLVEQQKVNEFFRINPPELSDSFIFIEKYDKDWEKDLNEYRKKVYQLNRFDDTTIVDQIIENLYNTNSFEYRMKYFFGIDFSGSYEWKYKSALSDNTEDKSKSSGVLIAGEDVYLAQNTKELQKDYTVARSEVVYDLMFGLIDINKELIEANKLHFHKGTPASVLDPDPNFITKLDEIANKLSKIQNELEDIRSPRIHIP